MVTDQDKDLQVENAMAVVTVDGEHSGEDLANRKTSFPNTYLG